MKKYSFYIAVLFLLVTIFAFTGCRIRIVDVTAEAEYEPEELEPLQPYVQNPPFPEQEQPSEPNEPENNEPENNEPENNEPENEEPNEPIEPETQFAIPLPEIAPEANEIVEIPAEESPQGLQSDNNYSYVLEEIPDDIPPLITIETPSPYVAGYTVLDAEGDGTLGLVLDHHTGILARGLGSLFECQRLYVYVEYMEDFQTVNRMSPLHSLIIDAGGFNAAARRGNDALMVDADWLQRRNPALIIRTVSSNILGRNVTDTSSAQILRNEILERLGIANISAIINRQVLLLSYELLQTYEGRLIAKLHIARAMYPTLFENVDLTEIFYEISAAGGVDFSYGIFAHPG